MAIITITTRRRGLLRPRRQHFIDATFPAAVLDRVFRVMRAGEVLGIETRHGARLIRSSDITQIVIDVDPEAHRGQWGSTPTARATFA